LCLQVVLAYKFSEDNHSAIFAGHGHCSVA